MRKILPSEFAKDQFYRRLSMKEAKMPFKSSKIRNYQIPIGSTNSIITNVCSGNLPKALILAMVDTESYSGTNFKDPLNYGHFDINNLNLKINGLNYLPQPLRPDFDTEENLMEIYRKVYEKPLLLNKICFLHLGW